MRADDITFRQLRKGDEHGVARMIADIFDEFIAPDYEAGGIEEFNRHITPEDILSRQTRGDSFVLLAERSGELVGVINMRDGSHIRLFFVRKDCQGRGIGRRLFDLALERCCRDHPALDAVTVNSSPYAVPIYESLGFAIAQPEQVKNGIRHTPMIFRLPPRTS